MITRYAFTTDKTALTIAVQLPSLFISREAALNTIQNAIDNMAIHEDAIQKWELVEMKITVVPNAISKYQ